MENLNTYKTKVFLTDGSILEIDCLFECNENGAYSLFDGKTKKQYVLPFMSIRYIEFSEERSLEMEFRKKLEEEKKGSVS